MILFSFLVPFTFMCMVANLRVSSKLQRGALPLCPTANGLMFVPLSYELPVASQLQQVDGVLHKATDEIVGVEMSCASDNKVIFSAGLQELQRYLNHFASNLICRIQIITCQHCLRQFHGDYNFCLIKLCYCLSSQSI